MESHDQKFIDIIKDLTIQENNLHGEVAVLSNSLKEKDTEWKKVKEKLTTAIVGSLNASPEISKQLETVLRIPGPIHLAEAIALGLYGDDKRFGLLQPKGHGIDEAWPHLHESLKPFLEKIGLTAELNQLETEWEIKFRKPIVETD